MKRNLFPYLLVCLGLLTAPACSDDSGSAKPDSSEKESDEDDEKNDESEDKDDDEKDDESEDKDDESTDEDDDKDDDDKDDESSTDEDDNKDDDESSTDEDDDKDDDDSTDEDDDPTDEDDDGGDECGDACDIFDQESCGADKRCASWICDPDSGGAWDASICTDIGPKQLGEACAYPWQGPLEETCDKGLTCWETCLNTCVGSVEEPECADPSEACLFGNDGFLAVCKPTCDPLAPDCPDSDPLCLPNGQLNNAFVCTAAGQAELSDYAETCAYLNSCKPGLYCVMGKYVDDEACMTGADGCCTHFCDLDNGDEECMGEKEKCEPFYAEDSTPPGLEKLGICIIPD